MYFILNKKIRVPHGHLHFDDFFHDKMENFQEFLILVNDSIAHN